MPMFEAQCCGVIVEFYLTRWDGPDPCCDTCGKQMQRLISGFNSPFTGTLDKYDTPGYEPHNKIPGGHYQWRIKSSRLPPKANGDPTPEMVKITTIQEQKEFTKAEGLCMPNEINSHMESTADGMVSSSRPRGAWF